MATIVASLMATIGADTSGLKKGLDSAKTQLQGAATNIKGAAKELGLFGDGALAAAAKTAVWGAAAGVAYKATGKVVDFFKSSVNDTMDYAKAVRDVARSTNTSYEESSKFLQVADDLQIQTKTLQTGFRFLSKQGIQPTIQNIKDMAAEYQKLGGAEKAQYAMEMFGARSGMEMAKMLEMTSEQIDDVSRSAEAYGLVLDQGAIQKTEDYRLAVDELSDAWSGLKTEVGMGVIPVLADATQGIAKEIGAAKILSNALEKGIISQREYNLALFDQDKALGLVEERTKTAALTTEDFAGRAGVAAYAMQTLQTAYGATVTETGGLVASLGDLSAEFDPLAAQQKLFNEGLATGAKDLVDLQQAQLNAVAASGEMTASQVASAEAMMENLRNTRDLTEARKKGTITEGEYLRIMKDSKVTNEELNEVIDNSIPIWAQAGDSIASAEKSVIGLTTAFGDLLSVYDPVTTAQGMLNKLLAVGAKDEIDYEQNKLNMAAASGKLTEAQLAEGLAAQENLRNMRDLLTAYEDRRVSEGEMLAIARDGIVTNEELAESVGLTAGNMTDLQKATGITAEQWDEYGKKSLEAADVANGSLVETETLVGNIDKNWAGVKQSIDNVTSAAGIAAMAAEGIGAAIAAIPTYKKITIDIVYNQKGRPVGVGGEDEFFTDKDVPYGAAGGPLMGNSPYIVGERGPELFVPNTSGNLIPNNRLAALGGGDTYNIYNNSTGAAALTMAIIAQSHRARLSRSMGG